MQFAPEGKPFFIGLTIVTVVVFYFAGVWAAVVPFVLFLFMFVFFRDPDRVTPDGDEKIASPADGRVIIVENTHEGEYLQADVLQISIFMSPLNVHVNRVPFAGAVKSVKHNPGAFYKAFTDEAFRKNENIATVFSTSKGDILVRQVAGSVARRAVCRVAPGDTLRTGERFGIIKFSSRVDLFLPPSAKAAVKPGDMVRAGESVIATWQETA